MAGSPNKESINRRVANDNFSLSRSNKASLPNLRQNSYTVLDTQFRVSKSKNTFRSPVSMANLNTK